MRTIGSWPWLKASVLLGAALFSLPGALRLAQQIVSLAPLPYEERRARVVDESYRSLRGHERTLPPGDVSILLLGPQAIDRGIFLNYYLYPRASHLYFDSIPVNAPRRSLLVTEAHGPVRRTLVKEPRAISIASRELLVPLVAAIQGGDGFSTEAIFESDADAQLTSTLMPSGTTRTYTMHAREPLVFSDLVFEAFGAMTTGWLRVRATQPVRANAWLVNRARVVFAPVPPITSMPASPQQFGPADKLWLLNPSAQAVTARVNGAAEVVDAGVLRMLSGGDALQVEGPVIAFTSSKTSDGNTRFVWSAPR